VDAEGYPEPIAECRKKFMTGAVGADAGK